MPELRLSRTRQAYEPFDPMNRLARIYLRHANGLIRDGRAAEAISAIDEAARILGLDADECRAMAIPHRKIGESMGLSENLIIVSGNS